MRALVLGATGHLGNAITRELVGRGWQVTGTSRRPEPAANLADLPVRFASGDSEQPDQLADWIVGHELVVDASAPYAFDNSGREVALKAAQLRMHTLLEAVMHERARLLHVSSFVTQRRARPLLAAVRSGALALLHPYFKLKETMEAQVMDAARAGVDAVVVRPPVCLGPWDLKPPEFCLIPLALNGDLPATSRHPVNVIDVRDVADAAVSAVERECFGEPINLAGHNITMDHLLATICRLGGARRPRIIAPAALTATAFLGNEALSSVGLSPVAYPSVGTVVLLEQRWQWPDRLQRSLGVNLRPLSRTLVEAIDWYREQGYLVPRTSTQARMAQAQATFAASRSRTPNGVANRPGRS